MNSPLIARPKSSIIAGKCEAEINDWWSADALTQVPVPNVGSAAERRSLAQFISSVWARARRFLAKAPSARLLLATLALGTTACDLSVAPAPGLTEIIAVVHEHTIVVPDTAVAGVAFNVDFATGGDGCFWFRGTKVRQTATHAEIEPRALVQTFALGEFVSACELGSGFVHRASLRYDTPGWVTIHIRSLRAWSRTAPLDTVIFERTVVIR
jgi:hypothetical protein